MTVTFRGVSYQCVLGSDVDRDGMYLELSEVVTGATKTDLPPVTRPE
jgi:hypothetical protein